MGVRDEETTKKRQRVRGAWRWSHTNSAALSIPPADAGGLGVLLLGGVPSACLLSPGGACPIASRGEDTQG